MRQLLKECVGYLKQNAADEQAKRLLERIEGTMHEQFPICILSRSDFEYKGYRTDNTTDEAMEEIADSMADSYVGYGNFWEDIEYYGEKYKMYKKEVEE